MSDSAEAESQEFHAELGYCFGFWTGIEMELLNVLRMCTLQTNFELLAGIFYAVENFRSKLAMVDTALKLEMKSNSRLETWTKKSGLHQRVIAASRKRNNLAHWMVLHLGQAKKPPTVYMLPNILKPSMANFEASRPSGGYYIHDLKSIRDEFDNLARDLQMFWLEWRGPQEMFQALKEHQRDQSTSSAQEGATNEGK